jgi:hypothetical protein
VVTPSGKAVVIMVRSIQAKSEGRGASMGLTTGLAEWSMNRVCMVVMLEVRGLVRGRQQFDSREKPASDDRLYFAVRLPP